MIRIGVDSEGGQVYVYPCPEHVMHVLLTVGWKFLDSASLIIANTYVGLPYEKSTSSKINAIKMQRMPYTEMPESTTCTDMAWAWLKC